jgi:hypothetical protein
MASSSESLFDKLADPTDEIAERACVRPWTAERLLFRGNNACRYCAVHRGIEASIAGSRDRF